MSTIINGKELATKIRENLKAEVEELKKKGILPKLAVIMVGNDSASAVYVRNKSKACNEIGIEFEEFPAQIAQVAMWLIDHQMNLLISNEFGQYFARLPLKKSANIVQGNALRIDWDSIILPSELSFILKCSLSGESFPSILNTFASAAIFS